MSMSKELERLWHLTDVRPHLIHEVAGHWVTVRGEAPDGTLRVNTRASVDGGTTRYVGTLRRLCYWALEGGIDLTDPAVDVIQTCGARRCIRPAHQVLAAPARVGVEA